jgi:uncharacterized membrane protein
VCVCVLVGFVACLFVRLGSTIIWWVLGVSVFRQGAIIIFILLLKYVGDSSEQ